MKVLVIICSHILNIEWCNNIKILNEYMKLSDMEVDYAGISNQDDFNNYENIILFKYKMINYRMQFNKICDFVTHFKSHLDYDWYIKFRPDIRLLEKINFDILSENAVNARARVYKGPKKIKYGMSINGEGIWKDIGDCEYLPDEVEVVIDDHIFIFNKNIVQLGAFDTVEEKYYNEWGMSGIFNERKIPLNVIGLNLELLKYNAFSGNLNC